MWISSHHPADLRPAATERPATISLAGTPARPRRFDIWEEPRPDAPPDLLDRGDELLGGGGNRLRRSRPGSTELAAAATWSLVSAIALVIWPDVGVEALLDDGAAHAVLDRLGDIGCVFHDLERTAVEVEDRVVGGLDPDLLPPLPRRLNSPATNSPACSFRQNSSYFGEPANSGSTNRR